LSAILLVVAHRMGSEDSGAFTLADFRVVVCFLAGLALVSDFFYLRLHPHAGASVSGHLPATMVVLALVLGTAAVWIGLR
jgi:hypothetical protein